MEKGGEQMPYSEAQKEAPKRYKEKKGYVKINIDVTEEVREKYKAQAAEHGKSLSAYIIGLLEKDKAGESNDT